MFGQHDHLGGGRRVDCGDDLLRRGVHRLAALDHAGRPEALEETPVSLPGRNDDDARLERRQPLQRLREALLALERLPMHVGDLDAVDRPGGRAQVERRARVVGVDVHLQRRRVTDDEERVAELLELGLERLGVEPGSLDDEDGAVAELRELLVDRVDRGDGGRVGRSLGNLLARDRRVDATDDLDEPCPARVDDARLLQHREELRRPRERLLSLGDDVREQLGAVEHPGLRRLGRLCHLADHGQHRPLHGPPDGAVGGVARGAKGAGDHGLVDRIALTEHIGEAAHDLAEDHAGVAAGAHEGGAGELPRDRLVPLGVGLLERLHDRAHREGEVRARVAVRDRVDVEVVDPLPVRLEVAQCEAGDLPGAVEVHEWGSRNVRRKMIVAGHPAPCGLQ